MADEERSSKTAKKRSRPLNYFYLNDNLHKKLHINRGTDEITTWCYPTARRVTYSYSDLRKRMAPAFTTPEVCRMLNRRRRAMEYALASGDFEHPQHTYGLNENKNKYKYMWSEQNVLDAHEYFSNIHRGRPRKDGLITPMKLPTVRELRAMMRNQEILYIKVGDEFRPTWQAPDI